MSILSPLAWIFFFTVWKRAISPTLILLAVFMKRLAAELVFGAVRGSRFWSYSRAFELWSGLLSPVLRAAVGDGATDPETLGDWEACLSAATNKVDPNRIRSGGTGLF